MAEFIGDENYTLVERTWIRTSLDVSGLKSGYISEDDLNFNIGKTVLKEYFVKPPLVLYAGGGVPALSFVPSTGGPQLVSF